MGNKTILPPGFRFHPTDVELVSYYLKRKVMGKNFQFDAISEVELYKFSPWDLPDKSFLGSKDLEWYFFCPRDKKYPKGTRANRSTHNGYWKTTGQDRTISLNSRNVGMKKTLVFHTGKPPRGERTNWVMYEYRLIDEKIPPAVEKEAYVLCKIFKKSGVGPKIGEQYGAPFNEDEWEDYDCTDIDAAFPLFSNPPQLAPPESSNPPLLASNNNTIIHEPVAPRFAATGDVVTGDAIGDVFEMDGIQLDELALLLMDPTDNPQNLDNVYNEAVVDGNAEGIYQELSDLVNSIPDNTGDYGNYVQPVMSELGNENFLELNDIFSPGSGNRQMGNDPFDWSLMQDNYGGFPQYPSENVSVFVNSQGHNGPFTELDQVVNLSNYQVGNFGPVYPKFM